jgi:hypothetical protein
MLAANLSIYAPELGFRLAIADKKGRFAGSFNALAVILTLSDNNWHSHWKKPPPPPMPIIGFTRNRPPAVARCRVCTIRPLRPL